MPGPDWNAVFAKGGAAPAPVAPAAAQLSGPNWNSVFGAQPSQGSGGGGGVLGALERLPSGVVNDVIPTVENVVLGTGRLVKNIVAPGTHPSWGQLAHEYTHPAEWFSRASIQADPLARDVVAQGPAIKGLVEHPLRHPVQTALLFLPLAAGAARLGLATRAGYLDPAGLAKPGAITARAAEGGAPVTVRQLPRDPYRAGRMKLTDAALKAVTKPETPVVGEYARAARAVERTERVPYLRALADPRLAAYGKAIGKLDKVDRVALATLARVPLPADLEAWRGILAGQDTEVAARLGEVLADPKMLERYTGFERFPKIVAAHEAAQALVGATEEIGLRTEALTPETVASAPFIGTRVARGAEFVTPTPARLGVPNAAHRVATQRVARLEKLHAHAVLTARRNAAAAILGLKGRLTVAQKDSALAVVEGREPTVPGLIGSKLVTVDQGKPRVTTTTRTAPRTPEEAQVRLSALEAQHNAQLDAMAEAQLGKITPQMESGRSKQNKTTMQAQAGVTSIGRRELLDREKMEKQRALVARLEEAEGRDDPGLLNIERMEARVASIDEMPFKPDMHAAKKDDLYLSVFSSLARTVQWHKFPTKRAAVVAKLAQLRKNAEARIAKAGASPELVAARAKLAKMEADHDALYRGRNLKSKHPVGNYSARKVLPSVREERRALQHQQIQDALAANPDLVNVPHVGVIAERLAEMEQLRAALGSHNLPEWAREPGAETAPADFGVKTTTETVTVTRPGAEGPGRLLTPLGGVRAEALGYALSHARGELERLEAQRVARMRETGLVGGGTPEQIAAQVAAAGRPQPIKLPDRTLAEKRTAGGQPSLGSGLTPPEAGIRQSTGALMRTGNLDLTSDVLSPHFLGMARFEAKQAKHAAVREHAVAVPKGAGLPPGMEWVRTTRGQTIPHLESVKLEHLAELDRIFPDEEHPFTVTAHAGAADPSLIETDAAGNRLAVSRQFAQGLAHQYRAEGRAVRWIFQKPLDVWRALVLNLRIPWLINNIVGNTFLYGLRFAGNGGLRAYVQMIADMKGPLAARRLLNSDATRRTLSPADIAEIFPEQTRGTFIGTQLPTGAFGTSRVGRVSAKSLRVLNAGLAPLDRRTEQFLRRGGVNAVLRDSPEAKRIYKAMPRQTRSWREAMLQAARGNGALRDLAVREVNDALGDYLSLTPFERGVLRRAAPFYGWYREITRIAAHTIVDRPLRVLILSRLAQLENDEQVKKRGAFPSFLAGSLALGPGPQGTENILALRSANPFSTVVDLGRAGATIANPGNRANAQALLGLVNPFAEAGGQTLFGSSQSSPQNPAYLGGAAAELAKYGLPGQILAQVAGGLPQVQAASPPQPSRLYPLRDRAAIIEALLGSVLKQPSLQQAHYDAAQGR